MNFLSCNLTIRHWAFAVVIVNDKKTKYYDSLTPGMNVCHSRSGSIKQLLTESNYLKNAENIDWQSEYPASPQQVNDSSWYKILINFL